MYAYCLFKSWNTCWWSWFILPDEGQPDFTPPSPLQINVTLEVPSDSHDLPDEGQPDFTPPSPLQINVTPEVPSDSHDLPDGGQPNFIPPKYSEEYCHYNPKAGRSHAMPNKETVLYYSC